MRRARLASGVATLPVARSGRRRSCGAAALAAQRSGAWPCARLVSAAAPPSAGEGVPSGAAREGPAAACCPPEVSTVHPSGRYPAPRGSGGPGGADPLP